MNKEKYKRILINKQCFLLQRKSSKISDVSCVDLLMMGMYFTLFDYVCSHCKLNGAFADRTMSLPSTHHAFAYNIYFYPQTYYVDYFFSMHLSILYSNQVRRIFIESNIWIPQTYCLYNIITATTGNKNIYCLLMCK